VDISDAVESVIGKDAALARSVKIFLCQRYTGEKLKDIGIHFGIGESGVSQASRRIQENIKKDKRIKSVKNEDLTPFFCFCNQI
jgi:chromosomal replication initiation ATPase DnaA